MEDAGVIDTIGIDSEARVVLTIADHLDWSEESAHLMLLQEKINTYVRFIESGEMVDAYPQSRGRTPLVDVVRKYELSDAAREFFQKASLALRPASIELRSRALSEKPSRHR